MGNPNTTDLRLEISLKLAAEIDAIRGNLGITRTAFLKMELRKAVDSYPEKMKRDPNLLDQGPVVDPK